MLVLFQRETCPDCKPVRELLTRLQVSYVNVNVPKPREERYELIRVTGTKYIPALVDGDTVIPGRLRENAEIIAYLERRFGTPGASPEPEGAAPGTGAVPDGGTADTCPR
ncbi:glutaredoxin domain-containing protein [Nocardiopsis sp. CC223A]|uniref:glutaredoxin family protein n=1 Tax=Nocardiopsis sp. CC223A TaxID=3044051 RepID=UPI00278BF113|nr:glutaredoxin domain-containing protein [Nocardiopsis sp. CC223A]